MSLVWKKNQRTRVYALGYLCILFIVQVFTGINQKKSSCFKLNSCCDRLFILRGRFWMSAFLLLRLKFVWIRFVLSSCYLPLITQNDKGHPLFLAKEYIFQSEACSLLEWDQIYYFNTTAHSFPDETFSGGRGIFPLALAPSVKVTSTIKSHKT